MSEVCDISSWEVCTNSCGLLFQGRGMSVIRIIFDLASMVFRSQRKYLVEEMREIPEGGDEAGRQIRLGTLVNE